jgi:transposase
VHHCHGHPTTTQHLAWYTLWSSYTRAYEEQILLSLVNSTVQDVSIKEDVGYEAMMGMIDRHIERRVDWDSFTRLEVVGLDEISLKKGHRHFVAIVTERIENEIVILGVLPDRKKVTVKAFLRGIPKRVRRTIRTVCSDMYDGFVQAAKEVCGKRVKIVIHPTRPCKTAGRCGLGRASPSSGSAACLPDPCRVGRYRPHQCG